MVRNAELVESGAAVGGAIANFGVLQVHDSVFGGYANLGGAIYNGGEARLERVVFSRSSASSSGGAIYSATEASLGREARLQVDDSTFLGNHAGRGGAIAALSGSVEVRNSFFMYAHANEEGGAIWVSSADLLVEACRFEDVDLRGDGGAIFVGENPGGVPREILSSVFFRNGATRGGGIFAAGDLLVQDSVFEGNQATVAGGALFVAANAVVRIVSSHFSRNEAFERGGALASVGEVRVERTQFEGNRAKLSGGAIVNAGKATIVESWLRENSILDAAGFGAGIHNTEVAGRRGELTVESSALVENGTDSVGSGGALLTAGPARLRNSTLVGNRASWGGGIYAMPEASLEMRFCTIVGNAGGEGSGIAVASAGVELAASIVFGNAGAPDLGGLVSGVVSQGFNLFGSLGGETSLADPTDLVGEAPLLGELSDNGGPTPTMLLQPESPAVDAIPADACAALAGEEPLVDQRGRPRPSGSGCEIGAVEL